MKAFTLAVALAVAALTGCTNADEKAPAPAYPAAYFAKASLDGQPLDYSDGENNYIHTSYAGYGYGTANQYQLAMGIELKPETSNNNRLYITLERSFPQVATTSQKAAVWQTGDFTYSAGSQYAGAHITWFDATGKVWSSAQGNQTGSTFTVTSTTAYSSEEGSKGKICTGTFSSKLYSPTGETKTLSNGTFRGIVLHEL